MTDDGKTLDEIAEEIGVLTEEQDTDDDEDNVAREGEEFDPDEMRRSKDDYHGGWAT
jgi:hypothetical protein